MNFTSYFPFDNPRSQQTEVLDFLEKHWDTKKVFVIDAPTGVGKSGLAIAVARATMSGMILTDTKALQDQYHADFEDIGDLRGKSNFACNRFAAMTADEAPCNSHEYIKKVCRGNRTCDYYNALDKAFGATAAITNYAMYFGFMQAHLRRLAERSIKAEGPEPQFSLGRDVLICDEGHLLDGKLADMASFELDFARLEKWFGLKVDADLESAIFLAEYENDIAAALDIFLEQLRLRIKSVRESMAEVGKNISREEPRPSLALVKESKRLLSLNRSLTQLEDQVQQFISYREDEWILHRDEEKRVMKIAPMHAKRYFWNYMKHAAKRVVIMSASIGDPKTFLKELGVEDHESAVIQVSSPFDPKRSPIYIDPFLTLDFNSIDANLPRLLKAVDKILDDHPLDKGIIHTNNYKVTKYIMENSRHHGRLIGKAGSDKDEKTNQALVLQHQLDGRPTVLISPSMHTGIDLKGELSRFQIIPKMPYASLGDPYVKAKNNQNSHWYQNDVWKKIIQASGRSTRSETDEAVTYILDKSIVKSFQRFKASLPKWFKDRLHWV